MAINIWRPCRLVLMCLALVWATNVAVAQDHGSAEEAQAMVARAIALSLLMILQN